MKQESFTLPEMPAMEFAVTRTVLDAASPLNHNEAHIHDSWEVYVNLSGNVAFAVEDRLYAVSRGSVIVTMPYEYHHCIYRSDAPHAHYWITFSAGRNPEFLRPLFAREKGVDNRIDLDEEKLKELCGVLDGLTDNRTDELNRRILVLRFFRILMSGTHSGKAEELDKLPGDVSAALAYMDQHLREEFDIQTLAEACSVSVNTLERHFRESLGTSPFLMLKNKRLFTSMMYLRSGSSVTEAAMKSGFSDYSNYIQIFRKRFGITPGQYKKTYGG